jgi:hypothetical protein
MKSAGANAIPQEKKIIKVPMDFITVNICILPTFVHYPHPFWLPKFQERKKT